MRVEYINPFVEASYQTLSMLLEGTRIKRGDLYLKPQAQNTMGVVALVGLAGAIEGRVIFDMTVDTAIRISEKMNGEKFETFDELAKATITELANIITAQSITRLHELGFRFDLTPPALFVGDNMKIAALSDSNLGATEALIIPFETDLGKMEVNISVRERIA